ncbi:helix-turn-helix domain-containing protein, partial [Nocardia farcinica]|uniref:helix-turn-helix domain-containing protein n=1 Tax=Nocardia farcinica TaxID=37329 RepID=UPI0024574DDB
MTLPPGTPDLAVLALLVSVADTGSLGAAARRHGISQPAASMRISALERRLRLRRGGPPGAPPAGDTQRARRRGAAAAA